MDTKEDPSLPQYHRRNSNQDLQVPFDDVRRMSAEDEERPLPEGWVRQFDTTSSHHFYVDTRASPPRSIWVHPYEDQDWLYQNAARAGPPSPSPPLGPSSLDQQEKPSIATDGKGRSNARYDHPDASTGLAVAAGSSSRQKPEEKGFFTKLKDGVLGTKEEKAAEKAKQEREFREREQRYLERRRIMTQQASQQQQVSPQGPMFNNYNANPMYANPMYANPMYAPPPMAYGRRRHRHGHDHCHGRERGLGGGGRRERRMHGGMPLLGGLAGGLLLGDMIGGGMDGGGDDGGDGGGDGGD